MRYTAVRAGTAGLRRIRYCLPEIAASAFGLLAMTRVGGARKFVPASLRKRQVPRLVIARLRRSRGAGLPAGKGREPSPYQRRFLHFLSFPHFLQDVKRFRHGAQIVGPLFGGSMHCGARQDMLQFMVLREAPLLHPVSGGPPDKEESPTAGLRCGSVETCRNASALRAPM